MLNLVGQDRTFKMLESTMDLASARHSLIASNVANVDTPGYKAKDMAFAKELKAVLRQVVEKDMDPASSGSFEYQEVVRPRIFEVADVIARQDGNTVDIDKEMGKLAKTKSTYSRAITFYTMKLKMLKKAVSGE